jgi:Prefoldin, molecular chaperone implicated in de novo protein folding, alpha subunit
LFSLTHLSATKLLGLKPPSLRVIVSNEAVPFVKEGKSVFARFVIDVDKSLRRGDEVIVVSSRDELIAIGKMMVSGEEAMELETGEIVKIKKSIRGVY